MGNYIDEINFTNDFLHTLWDLQNSTSWGLQVDEDGMIRKQSLLGKVCSSIGNVCTSGCFDSRISSCFWRAIELLDSKLSRIESSLHYCLNMTGDYIDLQALSSLDSQFLLKVPSQIAKNGITHVSCAPFYMLDVQKVWNNVFGNKNLFLGEKERLRDKIKELQNVHERIRTISRHLPEFYFLKQVFTCEDVEKLINQSPCSKIKIKNISFCFYRIFVNKVVEDNQTLLKLTLFNKNIKYISLEEELPLESLLILDQLDDQEGVFHNIPHGEITNLYTSSAFEREIISQATPLLKKRISGFLKQEARKQVLLDALEKVPPEVIKNGILPFLNNDLEFLLAIARDIRYPLLSKFGYEMICEYINEKKCPIDSILKLGEREGLLTRFAHLLTFLDCDATTVEQYRTFLPNLTELKLRQGVMGCGDDIKFLQSFPLQHFPNLKRLSLLFVRMSDQGISHLQSLVTLERLDLVGCHYITDECLKHLQPLVNLKELHLQSCDRITSNGLQDFRSQHKFPLKISHSYLSERQRRDLNLHIY